MRLSLVGCGFVGQAIAQQLKGRVDLELTVTTTSEEHKEELRVIADRVLVIRASVIQMDCLKPSMAVMPSSFAWGQRAIVKSMPLVIAKPLPTASAALMIYCHASQR